MAVDQAILKMEYIAVSDSLEDTILALGEVRGKLFRSMELSPEQTAIAPCVIDERLEILMRIKQGEE